MRTLLVALALAVVPIGHAEVTHPPALDWLGDCQHTPITLALDYHLSFGETSLVAFDGQTAVVAWQDPAAPLAVQVFERGADGRWQEAASLTAAQLGGGVPRAVAVSGDSLAIGHTVGLSFALRGRAGWTISQTVPLPFGAGAAQTLDMAGPVTAIGLPNDATYGAGAGAVRLYRREGPAWSLGELIGSPAPGANRAFGASVAIDGNRFAVGEPGKASLAGFGGAAWVFAQTERGWLLEGGVGRPDGTSYVAYGASIDLHGGDLVVGAPEFSGALAKSGKVYRCEKTDGAWGYAASFAAEPVTANERFGSDVQVDGDRIAIGQLQSRPHGWYGVIQIYRRGTKGWQHDSAALPGVPSGGVGKSIALDGDQLLVGAVWAAAALTLDGPDCDADGSADGCEWAGSVDAVGTPFGPIDGSSIASVSMSGLPEASGDVLLSFEGVVPWNNFAKVVVNLNGFQLGKVEIPAFAPCDPLSRNGLFLDRGLFNSLVAPSGTANLTCTFEGLVGSCPSSWWNVRLRYPRAGDAVDRDHNGWLDVCDDCDGDGVPDQFALESGAAADCNGNGRPDACDIAAGDDGDCDGDGVPDRCQFMTGIDGGVGEMGFGGSTTYLRTFMLRELRVSAGKEVLGGIAYRWDAFQPSLDAPPVPATAVGYVMVFDDPDQDGLPDDAVKLAQVAVTPSPNRDGWETFDLPDLWLGPPGTSYFVGIAIQFPTGSQAVFAPCDEVGVPGPPVTWIRIGLANATWPPEWESLAGYTLQSTSGGAWVGTRYGLIRSVTPRGVACIRGTPVGDLDADGDVGPADLAILLGAWGSPGPGDIDEDGVVSATDLALLLGTWTG